MDRWQELIDYLNMVAEWIQVVFAGFALYLAWNYLKQHNEKLSLESKRYSAENGLKSLMKIHQTLNNFFHRGIQISSSNFEVEKNLIKEEYSHIGLRDIDWVVKMLFYHKSFLENYKIFKNDLENHKYELATYGNILKDLAFENNYNNLLKAIMNLEDFMILTFPNQLKIDNSIQNLRELHYEMPEGLNDGNKKLISDILLYSRSLRDLFLKNI